jgi:serine protease Do
MSILNVRALKYAMFFITFNFITGCTALNQAKETLQNISGTIENFWRNAGNTIREKFGKQINTMLPSYELPKDDGTAVVQNSPEELAALNAYSKIFSSLAKHSRPALVFVKVKKKVEVAQQDPFSLFEDFFGNSPFGFGSPFENSPQKKQEQIQEGSGSGFFVDLNNGFIATNNHVIENASEISVKTFAEKEYIAQLVGAEPSMDIAVLKVTNIPPEQKKMLSQLSFSEEPAQVGDWVVALGAPFGLPQTLTVGVVSALGRGKVLPQGGIEDFIQTDASINPGNSGGPLLNLDSKVVGINTAISSPTGGSAGIGFSIPVSISRPAIEMIVSDGKVTRGFVGLEGRDVADLSDEARNAWKLADSQLGVVVTGLVPEGPAEKSGLKTNDIIVSLNNEPIENYPQFRAKVSFLLPESIAEVRILRDGKPFSIKIKISKRPDEKRLEQSNKKEQNKTEKESITTEEAEDFILKFGLSLDKSNIKKSRAKITSIRQNTPSAQVGLQVSDVILEIGRSKFSNLSELALRIKYSLEESNEVILTIERNGRIQLLIFQM